MTWGDEGYILGVNTYGEKAVSLKKLVFQLEKKLKNYLNIRLVYF